MIFYLEKNEKFDHNLIEQPSAKHPQGNLPSGGALALE